MDTGVLYGFSAGDNHSARLAFLALYDGRVWMGPAVKDEVRAKSLLDVTRNPDQAAAIKAARTTTSVFLREDRVPVDGSKVQKTAAAAFRQLQEYEKAQQQPGRGGAAPRLSSQKHSGEAELIALAVNFGDSAILLTNDTGASAVGRAHKIDSRHLGHLARELVCLRACEIDEGAAVELFERGRAVSGVADAVLVEYYRDKKRWMRCKAMEDGTCLPCDAATASVASNPVAPGQP